MRFQIVSSKQGYIVEGYFTLPPETWDSWHPLRNFGDRQSDAIEFKYYDCPNLDEKRVIALAKMYKQETKYIRVNGRQFKRQREHDI